MDELRSSLAELSGIAAQLNHHTDALMQQFASIEGQLAMLALGVDTTDDEPLTPGKPALYLAYGRHRGSWRLLVREVRPFDENILTDTDLLGNPPERIEMPLVSASRELRIAARARIVHLMGALKRVASDSVARLVDRDSGAVAGALRDEWRVNTKTWELRYYNELGRMWYSVDLEKCKSSEAMLDYIMQVAAKEWATDRIIGGLVRALYLLVDPQATLCSGGMVGVKGKRLRKPVEVLRSNLADALKYGVTEDEPDTDEDR
jgi:hypothetical protein